jgi:hypothetical protein
LHCDDFIGALSLWSAKAVLGWLTALEHEDKEPNAANDGDEVDENPSAGLAYVVQTTYYNCKRRYKSSE